MKAKHQMYDGIVSGANDGYINDPTQSYRKPMSKEMTTDGRMP
jgi:hypothetical protein